MRLSLCVFLLGTSLMLGERPPRKGGTAAVTNPLHGDADAEHAGKKNFEKLCAGCHGPDGKGATHYPSLRSAKAKKASDASLFNVITKGVPAKGMPGFSQLSETERWQIVSYLRSLK